MWESNPSLLEDVTTIAEWFADDVTTIAEWFADRERFFRKDSRAGHCPIGKDPIGLYTSEHRILVSFRRSDSRVVCAMVPSA